MQTFMFSLGTPFYEIILRAGLIYVFLLIAFRLLGKRELGEMGPFDFILLLIISESVQNAIIDDEKSIWGGLIAASTLLLLNLIIGRLSFRFRPFEKLVEGTPTVLIHNGSVLEHSLKKEKITRGELQEALREEGLASFHEVAAAILETNGRISVIPRSKEK